MSQPLIAISDLQVVENEPRVADVVLAKALGLKRPTDIRKLVARNMDEIASFGFCATVAQNNGERGRPSDGYLLNEHQALLVAILSKAPNAAAVRKTLIDAFVEFRRGNSVQAQTGQVTTYQPRQERQHSNRVRFWKLRFAEAAACLDDLGVDIEKIDMRAVRAFGRFLNGRA